MAFKDRIGIDLGRSIALEDGITWAARNGVHYFDAQTDIAPNAMESFGSALRAHRRSLRAPRLASGASHPVRRQHR